MRNTVTTALLNSTTLTEGFIRPTELERRMGRLMRAPDHDAGTADAGAATAAGDGAAGDDTSGAGGGTDEGVGGSQTDDATVLGSATADDGAGDDKGGEGKEGEGTTAKPDDAGVPETYELKLTTKAEDGEDTTVELDPSLVEAATPVFKDIGLSNEQANKLLHLVPEIQAKALESMNSQFAETRANWVKEAKADAEIGGKNWTDTQRLAARGLDHFFGPSKIVDGKETEPFRALLNDSGMGNHPTMIRGFRSIGEALSEDGTIIRNTTTVKQEVPREARNYPEDQPKS